MQLLVKKSKAEHMNHTVKSSILYLWNSSLLVMAISMTGCSMNNPEHRPPIEGTIKISMSHDNKLCFMPLFSSAMSSGDYMDLDHIKMEELAILDPKRQGGGYVLLRIKPKNKKYFILRDGQKICLNSNNSDLVQTGYMSLDKQLLSVSISGLDDKKEHSIIFYREFDYPYIFEQ